MLGWKEFEMEVVRDKKDNCIIICSIENVDPMGVHTGDSITVAPALTLTDKEYQIMRDASIAVLREIGVETGGSNVQFAVNPADGRLVVIEMNPRVSRSSALASKATGFPIAKVAAKLAVGYTLDEIANDITGGATPASFEPTIDYVVTKIPRFAFEKFPGADAGAHHLDEIGRRSDGDRPHLPGKLAEGAALAGDRPHRARRNRHRRLRSGQGDDTDNKAAIRAALGTPTPDRLLKIAQAMRLGAERRADPQRLPRSIRGSSREIRAHRRDRSRDQGQGPAGHGRARCGGSRRWASPTRGSASSPASTPTTVTAKRRALGVRPVFKRIDTCAAEFASPTAYMYSTYETPFAGTAADEAAPSDKKKVIILGGGPNRIGQGIEFDYCCCHAAFALKEAGYETIMVNCNPETVSTDYDTSDRLYFEPLTPEDVLEIIDTERSQRHAARRHRAVRRPDPAQARRAAGESQGADPRHLARHDRPRGRPRPLQEAARQIESASAAERHRHLAGRGARHRRRDRLSGGDPSVQCTGRARHGDRARCGPVRPLRRAPCGDLDRPGELVVSKRSPLLVDRYLSDATEVDVDCLCDGKDTFIAGIMEHIEEAGIHSGDFGLRAAAAFAERRNHRRARAADPRARARAQCRRADERAIRHQGRRHLCAGGQSARLAHGAVRGQGDRAAGGQDRRPHHGRREPRQASISSPAPTNTGR